MHIRSPIFLSTVSRRPVRAVFRIVLFGLAALSPATATPPEDPLLSGNAAVSLTPAGLLERELTQPGGLFVWTTLRELEGLSAAQLRTLAHGLWRAQRRGTKLTAAAVVLEAWADRDLAGLTADILTLLRWEHSCRAAADHVAGIESAAAALWCRLAHLDWNRALPLLEEVGRAAPPHTFWLLVSGQLELPPGRLPVFLTTAEGGMKSDPNLFAQVLGRVMWSAVKAHGHAGAAEEVANIKAAEVRKLADSELRRLRSDPPFRAGEKGNAGTPPAGPAALRGLLAMDTAPGDQRRIPFRLLREVRKLTPDEAMELAGRLPRKSPPGHWLAWMLFMRAAEGDPVAAAEVAAETAVQLVRAGQPVAALYALRPDLDAETALREIRGMTSPERQRQALSGFLTGRAAQEIIARELGNPVMGFASQIMLPAEFRRAGLCRAAAAGAGEAALRLAGNPPWEPAAGRAMLREDIVKAWALSDLASLRRYVATLENPDDLAPVAQAFAFVIPLLPPALHLDPDNPLPAEFVTHVPAGHWACLAFEARGEAFRFFEQRGHEPAFGAPMRAFAAVAALYEPERARTLAGP
jgi:hypothetical protein